MNYIGKVAWYNVLAILVYSILLRLVFGGGGPGGDGLALLIYAAFAVGIHVLLCLIISVSRFTDGDKALGKAWLLSAGIVLVVGYSTCLGNVSL